MLKYGIDGSVDDVTSSERLTIPENQIAILKQSKADLDKLMNWYATMPDEFQVTAKGAAIVTYGGSPIYRQFLEVVTGGTNDICDFTPYIYFTYNGVEYMWNSYAKTDGTFHTTFVKLMPSGYCGFYAVEGNVADQVSITYIGGASQGGASQNRYEVVMTPGDWLESVTFTESQRGSTHQSLRDITLANITGLTVVQDFKIFNIALVEDPDQVVQVVAHVRDVLESILAPYEDLRAAIDAL
jgi:hypothetical protein